MKQIAQSGLCECTFARDVTAQATLQELGFKDVELILDPCFFKKPLENQKEKVHILGWRKQYHLDGDPLLLRRHPWYVLKSVIKKIFANKGSGSKNRNRYDSLMQKTFEQLPNPKLVVVHDNREVKWAEKLFGQNNVYYATDYNKIFSLYAHTQSYIGSRIHGAIPSLIHGAPVQLVYTTPKVDVLHTAISLLAKHYPDIQNKCRIIQFGDNTHINRIDPDTTGCDHDALQNAINQEKTRVRQIVSTKPQLSKYLSIS